MKLAHITKYSMSYLFKHFQSDWTIISQSWLFLELGLKRQHNRGISRVVIQPENTFSVKYSDQLLTELPKHKYFISPILTVWWQTLMGQSRKKSSIIFFTWNPVLHLGSLQSCLNNSYSFITKYDKAFVMRWQWKGLVYLFPNPLTQGPDLFN